MTVWAHCQRHVAFFVKLVEVYIRLGLLSRSSGQRQHLLNFANVNLFGMFVIFRFLRNHHVYLMSRLPRFHTLPWPHGVHYVSPGNLLKKTLLGKGNCKIPFTRCVLQLNPLTAQLWQIANLLCTCALPICNDVIVPTVNDWMPFIIN